MFSIIRNKLSDSIPQESKGRLFSPYKRFLKGFLSIPNGSMVLFDVVGTRKTMFLQQKCSKQHFWSVFWKGFKKRRNFNFFRKNVFFGYFFRKFWIFLENLISNSRAQSDRCVSNNIFFGTHLLRHKRRSWKDFW